MRCFRSTTLSAVLLVAASLLAPCASAQPGALDATFGDDGVVVIDVSVRDVAALPGGDLVVVGSADDEAAAWRLRGDGTPDVSFGDQGVATFGVEGRNSGFHRVAPHPSGGFAAIRNSGYSGSSCRSHFVLRVLGDGSPGEAWLFGSSGGFNDCGFGPHYENWEVWVREDERVVLAGTIWPSFPIYADCYALRYLPDGTPDPSFGEDGGSGVESDAFTCRAAALDDNDRVVFAIETNTERWGGLRLLSDGTLDPTFEPVADVPSLGWLSSAAVAPDGSVTLGGVNDDDDPTLVRFTDGGALDAGFGDGGVASFPELESAGIMPRIWALASQPDGKLLGLGTAGMFDPSSFVARVLPDGSLDPAFGDGGVASLPAYVSNMTFDADGRIVVAGRFYDPEGEPTPSYVLRLMNDVTVENEPSVQPGRLALSTPAPNPVSGHSTFAYTLTGPSQVRLAVYDVLGRAVAVLAEGTKPAGHHEAALDASRLAPGLYVARLRAGEEVATRRFTVLR